jgi:hypothetical protein
MVPVLALITALAVFSWDWIDRNNGALMVVGTFASAAALSGFAGLTYKLSRDMARFRFSPVLEVREVSPPKVGHTAVEGWLFDGVAWSVCVVNPGEVPVWVDKVEVLLKQDLVDRPDQGVWRDITSLRELHDESHGWVEGVIVLEARDKRVLTVIIGDNGKDNAAIRAGEEAVMRIQLWQERRLGEDSSMVTAFSSKFCMPVFFGKEGVTPRCL